MTLVSRDFLLIKQKFRPLLYAHHGRRI
ncbi:hypothetical protein Gogos_022062 [Gossypium gossypioides]|uniref:Uncharacterized protein n=1 Tax=Gossypium gossypioides TaxID=34282 RepID=A0A7J9D3Z7_GOSGO|nr:hypothetical protein [Gossypium gossypioides]